MRMERRQVHVSGLLDLSLSTPPPALSDNYKSGKELHLELSNTSYFLISSEAVEGAALNPT